MNFGAQKCELVLMPGATVSSAVAAGCTLSFETENAGENRIHNTTSRTVSSQTTPTHAPRKSLTMGVETVILDDTNNPPDMLMRESIKAGVKVPAHLIPPKIKPSKLRG